MNMEKINDYLHFIEWCHNTATPGIEMAINNLVEYSVEIIINTVLCAMKD